MVRVSLRFNSCHFNFFPQINQFYYLTSLHVLQDVENHCAHLRDISWRVVEKFHISAFPMYYSLCNWIGEHEITKLKKKICFQSRGTQRQAQKDMNEMEWHKKDYLIFSAMRMCKRHLFCISSHHNALYEKQPELNKGSEPWNEALLERVRNC